MYIKVFTDFDIGNKIPDGRCLYYHIQDILFLNICGIMFKH